MHSHSASLPSLFVPHGTPTFALRPGAVGHALACVAAALPRPRAIIIASPHWSTPQPVVGFADRFATFHDFFGFPRALYTIEYPASGCREAAAEVLSCLRQAGIAAEEEEVGGLDHGAWIPLRLLYPDADVPVIPLSIQAHCDPSHHLILGRALAPLAARGFLIVASGNLTHNPGDLRIANTQNGAPTGTMPDYVRGFAEWFWQRLEAHDLPALLDYRHQAPDAIRAHPEDDHLLPFYVALGAAAPGGRVERLHAGVDDYVLAMDAFSLQTGESV